MFTMLQGAIQSNSFGLPSYFTARLVTVLRPWADFSPQVQNVKALSRELLQPHLARWRQTDRTSERRDSIIPQFDSCSKQMINAD